MTKTCLLRPWVGRYHVADLDVTVGHNDAINQQLDQLPFLRKRCLAQSVLNTSAEVLNATGQPGEFLAAIDLHLQVPLLLGESLGASRLSCRRPGGSATASGPGMAASSPPSSRPTCRGTTPRRRATSVRASASTPSTSFSRRASASRPSPTWTRTRRSSPPR